MFKNFFGGNMKKIFVSLMIICVVCVFSICMYSCTMVTGLMFERIEKTSLLQMQIANEKLTDFMWSVEKEINSIANNKSIFFNFTEDEINKTDKINSILAEVVDGTNIVAAMVAMSDGKEYFYDRAGIRADAIQLQLFCGSESPKNKDVQWYNANDADNVQKFGNYYIVKSQFADDLDIQNYATVYFFISQEEVYDIMDTMRDKNNIIVILNNRGRELMVSDAQRLNEITKETTDILVKIHESDIGVLKFEKYNEKYIIAYYQSAYNGVKFFEIYERSSFYGDVYKMIFIMIILITLFVIILIYFYNLINRQYIKPLEKLICEMKNIESSSIEQYVNIEGNAEISILVNQYNTMLKKIHSMIEDVKRHEEKKHEAQIETMRYQIKPHFLYNTLSNVRLLAMQRGDGEISSILSRLSNMYRYLYSNSGNYVMLCDELEFIKNYISIMNTRYEDRINTFFVIDDSLCENNFPVFILQPIVENSIVHGLCRKLNNLQEGILRITINVENNFFQIKVWDNGTGISEDKREKIIRMSHSGLRDDGLGLYNVIKRLDLLYGKKYHIIINSQEGEYTEFIIQIPFDMV